MTSFDCRDLGYGLSPCYMNGYSNTRGMAKAKERQNERRLVQSSLIRCVRVHEKI